MDLCFVAESVSVILYLMSDLCLIPHMKMPSFCWTYVWKACVLRGFAPVAQSDILALL